MKTGLYRRKIKRLIDIILSFITIMALSPMILIVAVLVKIFLGSPIIFRQERPGQNEKIFTLYKFRTMIDKRYDNGQLLPDAMRLTRFGAALRRLSLDELPELINIIKGDMSFIGPRPLLIQYLPLYNTYQKRRHEVRPGLTGLAQVSGRNAISWEDKFNLDVKYVDNITFKNDLKIFLLTIKCVILREGISSETSATMEPFTGSNNNQTEG